ncbi:MAG: ABC transporter substrate-binding protein [Microbacterium sp.]|uniref:ABC transporter substrate-binding protein n=1 Tax=Microbacterium sp. TaxID=51671 RepID=UPI0039E382A5
MRTTRTLRSRAATAAAVGAVAALALAGCASDSEPEADDGPVTITWWTWNPDQETAVEYIDAFEKEHSGITIDHRFIQYSDYVNTVQLALTSGTGPDVFGLQVGALTEQFAPLAADLAPAAEEALGADWADKLTAVDQLQVDGKQVGLPWMITGGGLVWANQSLLDELGLEVPTSPAELRTFCKEVKAAGKDCWVHGAKDAWQNLDMFQVISNQIAPGKFYQALAGETAFDDPDFVKAFETWQGLFDDGIFPKGALATTAYPDANDAFKKGEAALILFGSWQNADTTQARLDQYVEQYGDDVKNVEFVPYFAPPLVDGATTGAMFGGPDVGFAVAEASAHREAAETFATWLAGSETAQTLVAKNVLQPALTSVPLDLSGVNTDRQRAALEEQGPALADMIGQRELTNADVKTALSDALSAVASGQQSPADAAKAVQAAIDAAG